MNTLNQNTRTKKLTLIAIMAAILCIIGPFSLPIGLVPISLTNLGIYISIYILGKKYSTLSYLIYILIGSIGFPVFSGFSGGFTKVAGPTGGYLIGFIFMAYIGGIFIDKFHNNIYLCLLGLIIGTSVTYLIGTAWLSYTANLNFMKALTIGVIPFIPGDLIKILIVIFIGPKIRNRLISNNLSLS